mgnify:FL=1
MKKLVTVALVAIMLVMSFAVLANATTSSELADKIYEKGATYGMTSADKVKIERYLAENPVTDAEAESILAKVDQAVEVMKTAGVTSYDKLTTEQKNELKTIAKSAAEVLNVTLVFKTSSVEIYKDGKLIETVTSNNGKLAYTGNNVNVVLVVSAIAIIALATTVVAKKTFANAK